ncbi:M23 family metallopeptidase [Nocardioides humilatus]|uniref:M23 family metallopeptidase n=1 Tax=Nocardioides humilatus TaxID=2607660 RepID=A0A5B1L7Z8_9ACTN|nr:M23 family metallopeptidase [Nocardioides humilatus]KAA1415849.1 M23 family metallopeptidase [Nocardioides humilatus]
MNQNTARRVRRAAVAPALIGAIACSAVAVPPSAAAADSAQTPAWLVTAKAQPARHLHVVRGLTVRPVPRVLPVTGYHLTARFDDAGGLWSHDHTGLDFAAPEGTALRAIADAVVVSVEYDGAYGNKTVVRLEDGTELWYCHQSRTDVVAGQHVKTGEIIGAVGSTGNTTGPHLHLEVRPGGGDPVDPEVALAKWGVKP